jgi:predicted PurR-regulated permease PerM
VELPASFFSNVLMALAISLIVSFIVMTVQGWLHRLRSCGGLLTFVTVIGILLAASYLLHTMQL